MSLGETIDGGQSATTSVEPEGIHLTRYDDNEMHDLICVGFGPASLAIAVALYDALDSNDPDLKTHTPRVRFLERQEAFAWHAGMLLPGARLQISFIKDLATLRNPRSKFTFLNYLHEQGRLVSFTNLGTFRPLRLEYEDYMRWCAKHFADVVDYGQTVESVQPGSSDLDTGAVRDFVVCSKDKSGIFSKRRAKHVVIAVGGRPNLAGPFDINHPRIIHSSQYATSLSEIFSGEAKPSSVAVIGAGQSAAEVFHDIGTRFPAAKAFLVIKDSALRPSDHSPFVNEIFDPGRVDSFYLQEPEARARRIASDKSTNYGVVRIELLEAIYSTLYSYRIQYEHEKDWPQRILTHRTVTNVETLPPDDARAVRLHIKDGSATSKTEDRLASECLDADLVVVASGYATNSHESMLGDIRHLVDADLNVDNPVRYPVGRDYRIRFKKHAVETDAGIWLQGCNESTHGLSDTLLSILSTRGGEIVKSIFSRCESDSLKSSLHSNNSRNMNGISDAA